MKKFKRYSVLVIYVLLMFFCTGCWDIKLYEDMGLILAIGMETGENRMIKFTRVIPTVNSDNKIEMQIISNEADLIRAGRELAKQASGKNIEGGKTQQLIFSKEIAQKGIHNLLEVYERSPANPLLAYVVVTDGSPNELIQEGIKQKSIPQLPFYINQLIQSNSKDSYTVDTRIYNFEIDYFATGIDPVVPYIDTVSQIPVIVGSALFSGDKMVGGINTQKTGLLLSLMNKRNTVQYIYQDPDLSKETDGQKSGITISINQKKRIMDISFKNSVPVIKITLNFSGILTEYKWDDMQNDQEVKKVEELIKASVRKECNELMKYMQEVGSDPIGFGEMIRSRYNSYWKNNDWKEAYKKADINIDVNLKISNYGVIN